MMRFNGSSTTISRYFGLGFLLLALMAGCATPGGPKTPEEIVGERAEARWNALVAGDWKTAYSFATPAYRNAIDVEGFRQRTGGQGGWLGAEVRSVVCEEDVCNVLVRLGFRPILPRGIPELHTDYEERWVYDDGSWWIFQRY